MPRRLILTTATLAAFLTSEARLFAGGAERAAAPARNASARPFPARQPHLLELDDQLLAVEVPVRARLVPGTVLPVAVQSDPPLPAGRALHLWVGIKNGWGSQACRALPEPGLAGFLTARVEVPWPLPAQSRLWLGLERADGRVAKAALPLAPP